MILVFGGTTEGRKAVQALEEAGTAYYYSTRSSCQEVELVHGRRLNGALETADIERFCRENGIRLLVDAAHPFAVNVHRNIAAAAEHMQLPLVRYERQYPPRTETAIWCSGYADAISRLRRAGITRLLALTGVQTIGRLSDYWREHDCWFRILDRDESQAVALKQGFPEERLVYYRADDTLQLIRRLRPQAILTKESGYSGGFDEKMEAARRAGIGVFVVCRPQLYAGFDRLRLHTVNGPHGLRLAIQQLLPDFFPLKTGLTTGTCATAAAVAAFESAFGGISRQRVSVRIPDGEDVEVCIHRVEGNKATVIKHAGDDPDLTDGLAICAEVAAAPDGTEPIDIRGGEGVGTVTLPGLGLPIGAAAINETPQRMIRDNISRLTKRLHLETTRVAVTISVPEGRSVGASTFNPRIGVVGGISIIGTSGIVRPFSADAWISSIRKEMSVGLALTPGMAPQIVINSGAKSEQFLRTRYPRLPEQAFVHYGNFIGETLHIAASLGVRHLAMGVMIGKAVKLAEGNLDTHSHKVTMNRDFILQMATEARIAHLQQLASALPAINMARQLWQLLPADDMLRLGRTIIAHCHTHCDPLLPGGKLDILLISDSGTIIE